MQGIIGPNESGFQVFQGGNNFFLGSDRLSHFFSRSECLSHTCRSLWKLWPHGFVQHLQVVGKPLWRCDWLLDSDWLRYQSVARRTRRSVGCLNHFPTGIFETKAGHDHWTQQAITISRYHMLLPRACINNHVLHSRAVLLSHNSIEWFMIFKSFLDVGWQPATPINISINISINTWRFPKTGVHPVIIHL